MTSKRQASNYLTDRNWDEEEEKEDPGTFVRASNDVIEQRVIKRARHRQAPSGMFTEAKPDAPNKSLPSAFSGFAGFTFSSSSSPLNVSTSVAPANVLSPFKVLNSLPPHSESQNLAKLETVANKQSQSPSKPSAFGIFCSTSDSVATTSPVTSLKINFGESAAKVDTNVTKQSVASSKPSSFGIFCSTSGSVATTSPVTSLKINFGESAAKVDADVTNQSVSSSKPSSFGIYGSTPGSVATNSPVTSLNFNFGGSTAKPQFGFASSTPSTSLSSTMSTAVNTAIASGNSEKDKKYITNPEFAQHVECLNQCFVKWISSHIERNPYCILTPTFSDYEQHLKRIEVKFPSSQQPPPSLNIVGGEATAKTEFQPGSPVKKLPVFPVSNFTSNVEKTKMTFGFFGASTNGSQSSDQTSAPGFSTAKATVDNPEEEEYVPPKPQVDKVEEKNSLYTQRCKLFYQRDEKWVDKGVGNIHFKKLDDKCQVVMRADTNLGNILLNVIITTSTPISRQGKNNVSLLTIPNPPVDPKIPSNQPVPLLIRVKNEEIADELFNKFEELRK